MSKYSLYDCLVLMSLHLYSFFTEDYFMTFYVRAMECFRLFVKFAITKDL